jgi:hypothetical protein
MAGEFATEAEPRQAHAEPPAGRQVPAHQPPPPPPCVSVDDDLAAMALKFALSKPDPGAEDEAWQRVSAPRQPEWIYGRAVLLGAEPVGNKLTAE